MKKQAKFEINNERDFVALKYGNDNPFCFSPKKCTFQSYLNQIQCEWHQTPRKL